MSTVIYHAGAIGDFITAVPAIRRWRNANSHDAITLICNPWVGRLAADAGIVERFLDVNSRIVGALFVDGLSGEAREFLAPFSSAVLFTDNKSPICRAVNRAGIPAVFVQPPFSETGSHAVDYHLSLLCDPRRLPENERTPHLVPSKASRAASFEIVAPDVDFCIMHPGSGSRNKNWPFERFLAAAEHFRTSGPAVVWVRGPAEDGLAFPEVDRVASNVDLCVLSALLSRARFYIGNDSGITHVAAAVGCPTVAIFGPSDPEIWGPRGRQATVLYKKRNCSPCHRTGSPVGRECDGRCLTDITTEEVIAKATETLLRPCQRP